MSQSRNQNDKGRCGEKRCGNDRVPGSFYGCGERICGKAVPLYQIWRVETEAEARAHLEAVRKKYYDARHHCWCYLLKEGAVRYSDDGEPQGTAGQPMLNVFQRPEG